MDKLTLRVPFSQAERKLGRIGRDGEATVRQVLFDCRDALRGWENASIVCAYWRPGDDAPYLVPLTLQEDGVFAFVVRQEDVAKAGTVRMELRRIDGESVLKSATYTATVEKSLNADPIDPGSPEEDMLTALGEAAGQARTAAEAANEAAASVEDAKTAAESAAASATTAASNAQSVADTVQAKLDAGEFKGEKGDTGATGADGADGISPTVSTSKADGVTTVTITDRDGTHTATINDGAKGEKGDTGATGADGFSPTATVSKSGTTTTVTVTDKNGTTTADVKDGSDATVTRDTVVSALGYTPEAQPDTWTLIETITLTEATKTVSRTAKPDGTAYKLKRLHIIVESPSGVSTKLGGEYYLYCKDGTAVYCWEDNLIQTAEGRQAILLAEINRDTLTVCNEWRVRQSLWNTYTLKWTYGIITEGTWMHSISINGASNLPAGTKITIYGVDKED